MVKSRNLPNDLEPIFFDDRICQYFLGDFFNLLLCFFVRYSIQVHDEEFSLPHFFYLSITQASQRVVNRLSLWIQYGAFWHYPDVSFHVSKYINSKASVHAGCFR
jgi:hypothetical protein